MIKILFVIPEFSHGGTNKSLENLLSLIDKTRYKIGIYCLYEDGGEYYKRVFSPFVLKKSRLYYWLHDNVWTRKCIGLCNKISRRDNFIWLYMREARLLEKKYGFDTAIAYQEGVATQFISYMNRSVNRIAWIHCDYADRAHGIRIKEGEIYGHFNQVVCVSECAKKSLVSLYPEISSKVNVVYNLVNNDLFTKSNDNPNGNNKLSVDFSNKCFNIVSVGRLNPVKQFERIPQIAYMLKMKSDRSFRWYIIGSGESENRIRNEIAKYNVEDEVMLIGAIDNPYTYIKQADLVVCTSIIESFSYVIAEAKVLHTPIVTTDFPVAYEVMEESCGWIVNIKEMPSLLVQIIDNDQNIYSKKMDSIYSYEYNNEQILEKIDEMFGF